MSDHLTPEPSIPSNIEMLEGRLYDPTGQYARVYGRANNANHANDDRLAKCD
ncbi:hypothetical protein NA56DRAFT_709649 [Hyaloscypha hepaticicola]|uniref:Uncharacterized protein n=1 Tax=Hyaloscypha hepaticicola TaxID=2082293 RepID=A0A2J6PNA3_9HELO|nr:hypothetical protein NA56DRAFT_709649 [Hyaloscypha hepaticicola]